jgi:2'-5' RNA ligase
MTGPLKLIAILPPKEISEIVREEQQMIAERWGPKHAMRTPPHLTIIPPLAVNANSFNTIKQIATEIAATNSSFSLQLKGYGAFKPRVVYINPIIPTELQLLYRQWRDALETEIPELLDRYPDRPYHPHLTLAHRDVYAEQFSSIWRHYQSKSFDASFDVDSFWILHHGRDGWEPEIEFILNQSQDSRSVKA